MARRDLEEEDEDQTSWIALFFVEVAPMVVLEMEGKRVRPRDVGVCMMKVAKPGLAAWRETLLAGLHGEVIWSQRTWFFSSPLLAIEPTTTKANPWSCLLERA